MTTAFTTPSTDRRTGLVVSGDPPIIRGISKITVMLPVEIMLLVTTQGGELHEVEGIQDAAIDQKHMLPLDLCADREATSALAADCRSDYEREIVESFEETVERSD